MKIVVLDLETLTRGDLDFAAIEACGETAYYNILPDEEVIQVCAEADVVLINKTVMSRKIIEALPNLKYIGLFATGYNNVDLACARENNIDVVNVPGYSTDSVAQLAFAYILNHATNLPTYNSSVEKGDWVNSKTFAYFPYPIHELAGQTLGIVGYGSIGRKMAKIADAFDMKIKVYSRSHYDDCPYPQVDKTELFSTSDYITLNCPLNEETANLICDETLALMKKNAFLVNTSRGGVVDSQALMKALNEGRIAGAGIDVLQKEPMSAEEPLLAAKNCKLSPHVGWASIEARQRCVEMVADNISHWQQGTPINVVNK